MRRALAIACAGAMTAALGPEAEVAHGFYGFGAQVVSADFQRLEQGDDATTYAAVSGGGRYVAIQTRARNFFADDDPDPPGDYRMGGLFRFDLETKHLELVADGDLRRESDNALLVRGAQNPSISADGRYVAFSTAQQLVPADTNDNVDVYVRDMTVPARSTGAYELASAKDGGDVPASYAPPANPLAGRNPGSEVTRGAAISADGQHVVFRTLEPDSDLPDRVTTDTPGFQVWVRDRSAKTTTLVTRTMSDASPAGGAQGGATISADGSTVAWTGADAPAQTRFLSGESTDPSFLYYLWRRVADGPSAPTRRITGQVDLDDPGCPNPGSIVQSPTATGPCYGPLTDAEYGRADILALVPSLSSDGRTVAFLTGSGLRPLPQPGLYLDLWVTDMSGGVSRKAGTFEVTREGDPNDLASSGAIEGFSLSADGRSIAFATNRVTFVLTTFAFRGSHRARPDARELYVVDLPSRTIERVTRSVSGGEIDGDVAASPTLSADGSRVAFASTAANLFAGDANERSDAFVAARQAEPPAAPPDLPPEDDAPPVEQIDPDPNPVAGPRFIVRAASNRDGSVRLRISAPGAGTIVALAQRKITPKSTGRPIVQTLARGTLRPKRAGSASLVLKTTGRYRTELRRKHRVTARARVTYVAPDGRRQQRLVNVVFAIKKPAKRS